MIVLCIGSQPTSVSSGTVTLSQSRITEPLKWLGALGRRERMRLLYRARAPAAGRAPRAAKEDAALGRRRRAVGGTRDALEEVLLLDVAVGQRKATAVVGAAPDAALD